MDKFSTLTTGIALALTLAFLSALCATAFAPQPEATLGFFGAFMHGLDLNAVRSTTPMSTGQVLYGVIGLGIGGFVAGVVFASLYNIVSQR